MASEQNESILTICALVYNLAHVTCSLPEIWPYRCKQNNASHEKLNDARKKFSKVQCYARKVNVGADRWIIVPDSRRRMGIVGILDS